MVQVLFGSLGPPDNLRAMRGKQPENDYVLFTYDSYGISFHIKTVNNQNNVVDLIVVMESNVKITGVPFRVGDEYRLVTSQWGEPDRQEAGFAAYWHRGIFLGVNEQGRITTITVAAPGKVDEDQPAPSQGWVPPCLPGSLSVSGAQGASAPAAVPASSHRARAACGA